MADAYKFNSNTEIVSSCYSGSKLKIRNFIVDRNGLRKPRLKIYETSTSTERVTTYYIEYEHEEAADVLYLFIGSAVFEID